MFNKYIMASPELLSAAPTTELSTPPRLTVVIDEKRTEEVLGKLLELYNNNEYPYNLENTRVPHHPDHMPKEMPRGGKEHASFLWSVCYYMRGGIKSVEAVKRMAHMYDDPDNRYLFDFERAQYATHADVDRALKAHGLGLRDAVSRQWIANAKRMVEQYNGDPRTIFDGITHYDEALERIRNDHKRNGRQTNLVPLEYNPLDDAQRKAYERTCGRCALRGTCTWNIPGKPYYVLGELRRRGKRPDYPMDPTLF